MWIDGVQTAYLVLFKSADGRPLRRFVVADVSLAGRRRAARGVGGGRAGMGGTLFACGFLSDCLRFWSTVGSRSLYGPSLKTPHCAVSPRRAGLWSCAHRPHVRPST